ncbi:hypothetical protein [Mycobacterium talmoniae]|uniref:SnoaL-like domain-containing protein n=1 Tax=Mycobacterium talmoniae TaxID=1858794 RepID=A0A1S1NA89_9MYCO|nr:MULTISPECIES: hypothetical protein [Mycobacterium]OHU99124.1 hypothetical protein BKN37_19555 [Mycobacterium talmoniae]PQM47784.1 hypothetical protein C1Y40_02002 [Mycobacterium talmoniae]TDH49545.1 hypothetical protein E2F47_20340 [Mycobacterium eburneum]
MSSAAIGRRPADAAAFVASVQDATNAYLTEVIYDMYAADARAVMITDGAREESVGVEAIHATWARACAAFKARRFRLDKQLVAATEDTIVNEWCGGPHGRRDGCGLEVWRFDPDAKVIDLRAYNFLKVRSARHPLQVVQLLLGSPGMTLAAGRAGLRRR